ncbi:PTS sugar transporter subunit IIB [Agromyces sp. SYSU T00194]|uniref:PTS sugar transporter subunit IIB n=1 Tax=Agromyces chitinivorans TaxID=3158560 RepID=UPI00339A1A3E
MRILVVCGAGASSTFVAQRVRRSARDRGLVVQVDAAGAGRLEQGLDEVDVVLLGAHVGDLADLVRERAAEASVAVAVMTERVFAARDGEEALDLALEVAGARS